MSYQILTEKLPHRAIVSANKVVLEIQKRARSTQKRGKYNKYTPQVQANIGRMASLISPHSTAVRYTKLLGKNVRESTVREIMKSYQELCARKRKLANDSELQSLPPKKQGKPMLLGGQVNKAVQLYILKFCEQGGMVNSAIVQAAARGILLAMDRTRLVEYGGHVKLSNTWAKSLLHRMNFTKQRGTTKGKIVVTNFGKLKMSFLEEIVDVVTMENIPPRLIMNWDQIAIIWSLLPPGPWRVKAKRE